MNRYSNVEVSAYNPMTTQEIWAPAAAMRQQHNEADKQLQTQISELDKVDPLSVHYEKAQKIKSDLLNTISNQAETLATQGFNGNTTAGVYKTNRDLQSQFSPTGELGQINLAKKTYDTEKAQYLDDATKLSKIGREQALKNWENYAKTKYTGYSDDGKKIASITALGSPAFQDYETDRNQYHALLGSITSSAKASGHAVVPDPTTGLLMMVNRGGKIVHSDNVDALNSAMKGMKDKWISPEGEGRKWADAAGWDPVHTNYRINQDFSAMKSISNVDDRDEDYSIIPGQTGSKKTKAPILNDAIQDPSTIKNLNKDIVETDFSKIGKSKFAGSLANTNIYNLSQKDLGNKYSSVGGNNTYKSVLSPLQQKFYETAAKRLIKTGQLQKNADLNNNANAEKIGFYMKNHMKFPTVASDIIRADVAVDNKLFSGNLASKDAASRNRVLTQDLRQTKDGVPLRTMIDVEKGGKVKLDEGDTIDYLGVESPINYSTYGFENKFEQSVMGHRAQILDSKGNVKANVVISRTPNEMKDPTFKKMQEVNQTYKAGLNNLGEWVRPVGKYSGSKELAKTRVRVNDDNTFQIQLDGYQESPKMNNEQFIQQMQSIMEY